MSNEMTYENLVLPSLKMPVNLYKKLGISLEKIIIYTDNGKQYYAKAFLDYLKQYNMILSKKQPNKFDGKALSKNWFYHIVMNRLEKEYIKYLKKLNKILNNIFNFIIINEFIVNEMMYLWIFWYNINVQNWAK